MALSIAPVLEDMRSHLDSLSQGELLREFTDLMRRQNRGQFEDLYLEVIQKTMAARVAQKPQP